MESLRGFDLFPQVRRCICRRLDGADSARLRMLRVSLFSDWYDMHP